MTDIKFNNLTPRVNQPDNAALKNEVKRSNIGADFSTLLNEQLAKNSKLQFSKHAQERVNQRVVDLTPDLLNSLNDAVAKARSKGARDVVIINAKSAFIVNVPNNMVITTITEQEMKDNVFTNIDSAVIL